MPREDWYTNDEASAGEFERRYGPMHGDDKPTLSELIAEDAVWTGDEEELDEPS